jgi:multiple antibiotic resistance protein
MTVGLTTEERSRMSKSIAINSFLLLIASALIGAYVLDFFGVSIPSVQVAGGIVVCMIAWSLLNSPNSSPAVERRHAEAPDDLSERAFYPMTMPLTVGPGSISVAITLGANPPPGFRPLLVTALAHGVGILLVAVSVYFCYRYAEKIMRRLGPTGSSVVVRLTAFITLCIGVQIAWNGIHGLIQSGFPSTVAMPTPSASGRSLGKDPLDQRGLRSASGTSLAGMAFGPHAPVLPFSTFASSSVIAVGLLA